MLETVDAGERAGVGRFMAEGWDWTAYAGAFRCGPRFLPGMDSETLGVVLFCGTESDTKTQQRGAYPALLRYS